MIKIISILIKTIFINFINFMNFINFINEKIDLRIKKYVFQITFFTLLSIFLIWTSEILFFFVVFSKINTLNNF